MGEDNRNFYPSHHLWVMSQFMPKTDADDSGIWRRVLAVPFSSKPAKVNENLEAELKEEAAGIFAWMLRGCLEWQRIGLCPPESVLAKTAEIRAEDDVIGNFFDETCLQGPGVGDTEKDDIYQAYAAWCDRNRVRGVLPKNKFGSTLEVRGLRSRKSGSTRYWCDLMLVRGFDPVQPAQRGSLSIRDQVELIDAISSPQAKA
jgi:putative DNA primase/helicase